MFEVMECLSLWKKASEAEIGIAVKTPNKTTLLTRLYEVRKEFGGYENISICQPERFADELWLVKRTIEELP